MTIEKVIEQINMIKILADDEKSQELLIKKYIDDFNKNYIINEKNQNEKIILKNDEKNFKTKKITRDEYKTELYNFCEKCKNYKSYESYALSDMYYCIKNRDADKLLIKNKHYFNAYDSLYKIIEIYECNDYNNDIIDEYDIEELMNIKIILDEN